MKNITLLLVALIATIFSFLACGQANIDKGQNEKDKGIVKVLYFHGKQRCPTCMAVEEKTTELLDDAYHKAMQEGKLKFCSIDLSESEGEAIADSYEIAFSSLIIDRDGEIIDLTDMGFRYALNDSETFKAKLKVEIDKLLQ